MNYRKLLIILSAISFSQAVPVTTGPATVSGDAVAFGVNCDGKPDGLYADGRKGMECSQIFVECNQGVATIWQCPTSDLRFDAISGSCLQPQFVQACNGTATTPSIAASSTLPPIILAANETSNSSLIHPNGILVEVSNIAFDVDCAELPDGLYSDGRSFTNGCSPNYVTCRGGIARSSHCPNDTNSRFDIDTGLCLLITFVRDCRQTTTLPPATSLSSSATTTTPTTTTTATTTTTTPTTTTTTTTTTTAAPTTTTSPGVSVAKGVDCSKLSNGFFADGTPSLHGCSSSFVRCTNGIATVQHCFPLDLKFDLVTELCVNPTFVTACGGRPAKPLPRP